MKICYFALAHVYVFRFDIDYKYRNIQTTIRSRQWKKKSKTRLKRRYDEPSNWPRNRGRRIYKSWYTNVIRENLLWTQALRRQTARIIYDTIITLEFTHDNSITTWDRKQKSFRENVSSPSTTVLQENRRRKLLQYALKRIVLEKLTTQKNMLAYFADN